MIGMAIRVMGAAPSRFPTVPDGTPAVLVVLGAAMLVISSRSARTADPSRR